jgi:predicted esterase YcpF (UPF0227 family)
LRNAAQAIVYLHGFRSSPASAKAGQLRAAISALDLASRPALSVPELSHRPALAMAEIDRIAAGCDPAHLCFVGSSLGGFYAIVAAERHGARAVLINPAIRPDEALAAHAGVQTNLYTGAAFEVTAGHFAELRSMRVARITRPDRVFLLVETGDELLDYREAVAFCGGAWQFVRGGGDHGFQAFAEQIPAILRFAAHVGFS